MFDGDGITFTSIRTLQDVAKHEVLDHFIANQAMFFPSKMQYKPHHGLTQ